MILLEFLLIASVVLALLGLLHLVPNRLVYWLCVTLSAMYGALGICLGSWQAGVMSAYFLANAYLRVALAKS